MKVFEVIFGIFKKLSFCIRLVASFSAHSQSHYSYKTTVRKSSPGCPGEFLNFIKQICMETCRKRYVHDKTSGRVAE